MKVAIIHELLTMKGGAERVLRVAADLFPEAPIYTLLYDERRLGDWFPPERVRSARIPTPYALLPRPLRYNHHLYLSRFPSMAEAWDFSEFDVVLSFSSAFVHGILTNGAPKHLCYVHSPARYLWDRTHDVLERAGCEPFGWLRRWYLERTFHRLRIWDAEVAPRPDKLLAASNEVKRRIELYWRRDSDVVYPCLEDRWFHLPNPSPSPSPYFLIVSTLVPYKQIDIAVRACTALNLPLKIAGTGPDRRRLEKMAGPTIEFLGYVPDEDLPALYAGAHATIFPGEEDFGLVPLESMACGTPVIARRTGGALETVVEGKTGTFFPYPTSESLQAVLKCTDCTMFSRDACRARARDFGKAQFEKQIRNAIAAL